jgi:hypothetical protein
MKFSKPHLTGALVISLSLAALTACGGGGDGGTPAPVTTAEGAYSGTIGNNTSVSAFNAVVLEDGQFWTIYGNSVGGTLYASGLMQGQGASSNGAFTSSNIRDFFYYPPITGTLTASFVAGASLNGTVTSSNGNFGFNGTAIPAAQFNYNTPALLADVVGNWTVTSTSTNVIALSIAANGSYTGHDNGGCTISGTIAPRASGKNIFNVQMLIGPAPCALPGWTGGGIGIYSTLANGTHQLILATVDSSRTYGSAAFGTR